MKKDIIYHSCTTCRDVVAKQGAKALLPCTCAIKMKV